MPSKQGLKLLIKLLWNLLKEQSYSIAVGASAAIKSWIYKWCCWGYACSLDGAKAALARHQRCFQFWKKLVWWLRWSGLVFIYEGFLSALRWVYRFRGLPSDTSYDDRMINAEHHKSVASHVATEDITFGYCTEIMIGLKQGPTYVKDFDYEEFRNYLSNLGDSLRC